MATRYEDTPTMDVVRAAERYVISNDDTELLAAVARLQALRSQRHTLDEIRGRALIRAQVIFDELLAARVPTGWKQSESLDPAKPAWRKPIVAARVCDSPSCDRMAGYRQVAFERGGVVEQERKYCWQHSKAAAADAARRKAQDEFNAEYRDASTNTDGRSYGIFIDFKPHKTA